MGSLPKCVQCFSWRGRVQSPAVCLAGGARAGPAGPGKRSSCAGDARNKVPLPVRQPVICIQMRRKSCQARREGEGDHGCGKRGAATQCVPPQFPSSWGRLGGPISQAVPASLGVRDAPPSAAPSCPVGLFILSPFPDASLVPPLPSFISLFFCLPLLLSFAENLG